MSKQSFNLVIDPWIKVIEKDTNQEKLVSLTEFFSGGTKLSPARWGNAVTGFGHSSVLAGNFNDRLFTIRCE
ncbi:hypothetical protein [Secundilactobacillus collinoides]|uniref:hypothetical protein n=1 Tax=Secundilactobacillus collinoides TaxID=33960 RepID=UPI0034E1EB26